MKHFFLISVECPPLPEPKNGIKSCKKISGKTLCTMACNEGHSFNSEAMTTYGCGPDTDWKWNGMAYFTVPVCSSMLNLDRTYTSDLLAGSIVVFEKHLVVSRDVRFYRFVKRHSIS